jgi:ATP-dependent RNA circularization protein (DNA/RNA ligase family)
MRLFNLFGKLFASSRLGMFCPYDFPKAMVSTSFDYREIESARRRSRRQRRSR